MGLVLSSIQEKGQVGLKHVATERVQEVLRAVLAMPFFPKRKRLVHYMYSNFFSDNNCLSDTR